MFRVSAPRYRMLPTETDLNRPPLLSGFPEKVLPIAAVQSRASGGKFSSFCILKVTRKGERERERELICDITVDAYLIHLKREILICECLVMNRVIVITKSLKQQNDPDVSELHLEQLKIKKGKEKEKKLRLLN